MSGQSITGDITIEGVGGNFGSLVVSTTTDDVEIVPDATTSSSITLTLPPNIGVDEEALTTDGTGVLTWGAVPNTGSMKCWICTRQLAASDVAFNSGAWRSRAFTDVVSYTSGDTDVQLGVAPAGAGELLIADGIYYMEGAGYGVNVNGHMARVNVSGLGTVSGTSTYSDLTQSPSMISGFLEITGGPRVLTFEQRCTSSGNFSAFSGALGPTYTPLFLTLTKFI